MVKKRRCNSRQKTSRIKMVYANRGTDGVVFDRFMRFRYKGVVYTTAQSGVERKDPIKIVAIRCFPDIHLDPGELSYLRSRGIEEKDWEMTNHRVPVEVLREIDGMGR